MDFWGVCEKSEGELFAEVLRGWMPSMKKQTSNFSYATLGQGLRSHTCRDTHIGIRKRAPEKKTWCRGSRAHTARSENELEPN